MTRRLYLVLTAAALMLPGALSAQKKSIAFTSQLPRTLVFIQEKGDGRTATQDVVKFLNEAGFPLVDPALAHTAAQRELVQSALKGDEGAAVQLGRDFGAHVIVLGNADWGTTIDPVTGKLQTGTAEVGLRAIRLDEGKVLSVETGRGRNVDATEQMAKTNAVRQAVSQIIQKTGFVGALANNWEENPWAPRGNYFPTDPGSPSQSLNQQAPAGAPKLAIIRTDVLPPVNASAGSRGIGVVKKNDPNSGVTNDIALEGVVVGSVTKVEVEGQAAKLEPLSLEEAKKLGLNTTATKFSAHVPLAASKDTVKVVATSASGETATATAAPRIAERWAVVVGIGDYRADDIPDLRYASKDAQSVYDFLTSSQAGFQQDHVVFLKDGAATAQAVREALFVFLQKANYNDLVFIYFAGHGAPDPTRPDNLYLLPHDADTKQLAATGFPMWDVKTALRRQIKAERVIVVADACHSGGTKDGEVNPINGSFGDLFTPSRRVILTAADDNELSYEDAKWGGGHGAFTFNFIEGLKGAADSDKNGIVTFQEAADYVTARVKTDTNGRQNPQRGGLGDVPLSEVSPAVQKASK
ncbi:MAG TPA: caspase family protein [Longimicrobiales bacterium]|nr:caspase family protein [Longimicrobiales bacterium]